MSRATMRHSRRMPDKNIPLPVILIGATLVTMVVFGLFSMLLFGRKTRRPEMIITSSTGEVLMKKNRSGKWEQAENFATVFYQGYSVKTDRAGSASLSLSDEHFFSLGPHTEVVIATLAKGSETGVKYDVRLELKAGRLWVERNSKIRISVNTPAALVNPPQGACEIVTDGVNLRLISFGGNSEYVPHINEDKVVSVPEGNESVFMQAEKKIVMPKPYRASKLDEWQKQNLNLFRDRQALRRIQEAQRRASPRGKPR